MADSTSLEATYAAYIAAINAHDWDGVASFFAPQITHNAHVFSALDLAHYIEHTIAECPGLRFELDLVIADARQRTLAARIRFVKSKGKDVQWTPEYVSEHVFYEFDEESKITRVWSMVEQRDSRAI